MALVGLMALPVAACGSDGDGSSTTPTTKAAAASGLARTQWVLRDSGDLPTQGLSVTAE